MRKTWKAAGQCSISTSVAAILFSSSISAAVLEEVVVVSQKREEFIQDVPISMVRFGRETLTDYGIHSLADIGPAVPGLSVKPFNADPSAVRLFIRGIGNNSVQIAQDPSVALYIDGVYVGTTYGTGFEGVDVESIEVLRGPQGTLYGRNATGGAVNIVTARASVHELKFQQELTAGNLGERKSRTMVNVPVTDQFALKLNYLISQRDGYVKNRGPGRDFGEQDRKALVADLRWDVTDTLTLDYRYENSDIRDTQRYEQPTQADPSGGLAFSTEFHEIRKGRRDSVTSNRYIPRNKLDLDAHTLHAEWDVADNLSVRSISAYRGFDSFASSDALSTAEGNGAFYSGAPNVLNVVTEFKQYSQELQFIGHTDEVEYVAGLYYYKGDADWDNSQQLAMGGPMQSNYSTAKNTSYAAFGQATYSPAYFDYKLHFTFGARYSAETRKVSRTNRNINPPMVNAKYDKDFSNFNPSFGIAYDVTPDANLYAKVMTGFKSGGTSMTSPREELYARGFDEEEVISYEVGYKATLFNQRMRLNLAAFRTEMDGSQTAVVTGNSPSERDFLPLDDNVFKGFEADVQAQISSSLRLGLSYSYIDTRTGARYIDSSAGRTMLSGKFPNAPRHSLSATLNHSMNLPNGRLSSALNYSYQDQTITSINVADNSVLPSYSLLGATVTWDEIKAFDLDGEFSIRLWGHNLLDKEYALITAGSWSAFGAAEMTTFGDPRTYGVTLAYSY